MSRVEGDAVFGASSKSTNNNATTAALTGLSAVPSVSAPKPRSCAVCRSRKVRCDKQTPCSNCRRANIPCILPTVDRLPRWARRLERRTGDARASTTAVRQEAGPITDKVMDRIHNLESLVKELRGQLEQAQASSSNGNSTVNSPGSSTSHPEAESHSSKTTAPDASSVHKQFGRMVIQDANRTRFLSSAFWSRIDDELDGLKSDAQGIVESDIESSEEEDSPGKASSTQEYERAPSEHHSLLFGHNLGSPSPTLHGLQPLPSQIPFLLDVFSENVDVFVRVVHLPTLTKLVRESRTNTTKSLGPSEEALLFSVYYAAIISMEEDDVMTNFGSSKPDLALKYRLGLEHALAKADFLNAPNLVLVQAFTIFLLLARRHGSTRYVYMMVGLLIRMAQFLGLQRDGAQFPHLSPYEVEIRRRVWWTICMLDLWAAEDQGQEMTIATGSFDTKSPLNINESDIDPQTKEAPQERQDVTDVSWARITAGMTGTMRRMLASNKENSVAGLEAQSRLLSEIYQSFEEEYLRVASDVTDIVYWVADSIAHLIMAKMTLLVFLPVLLSSPDEHISDEIRNRAFVSAIEVAEYNHALNAEEGCRQWRWIYQTHIHWHAIVLLLIEMARRPWSPIIERAWVAVHSQWLIPPQSQSDKKARFWLPLRKLMARARKHRTEELDRLRQDSQAATGLMLDDRNIPTPSSTGPYSGGPSVDIFRDRWRRLVGATGAQHEVRLPQLDPGAPVYSGSPNETAGPLPFAGGADIWPAGTTDGQNYLDPKGHPTPSNIMNMNTNTNYGAPMDYGTIALNLTQPYNSFQNNQAIGSMDWSAGQNTGAEFSPWLWADTDATFSTSNTETMDLGMGVNNEVNWLNWVDAARGMEWDVGP